MNIKPLEFCIFLLLSLLLPSFTHAQDSGQKLNPKEIELIIDSLGSMLQRWYIYPDKAAIMVSSVKKNYKSGAYNNAKYKNEISRELYRDLQLANKDRHLEIVNDPQLARDLETAVVSDTASNRRAYESNLQDAKENNFAFRKTEILPGNIGYVRWDGFYEFVDEALPTINAAFQFVSNTRALIIDMRNNSGGSPEMVLQMQSYFFKERTPMNHIVDRNNDTLKRWADPSRTDFKLNMPVYILTSHSTFSGAEDFTYGMKYAKRAMVVGDTTGGGAHPTRPFSIGQGLVAFIPTHRSINMITHTDWDDVGVWPDIAVSSNLALAKAQALIFTELLSMATDERERKMLRWNLVCNENKALLTTQIQNDSIKFSKEELLKFCGEYNISDPNNPLPAVFTILKGNYIFRHLNNGAEDVRLIPVTANKFVYDDDSGRTIEFVTDKNSDVLEMVLSTPDGEFRRNKKK